MQTRKKVIAGILVLILAVGMGAVAVMVMQNAPSNTQTFTAEVYTQKDLIEVPAIALRTEVVLDEKVSGQADYHYDNGVKVVTGTSVASVYSSEEDIIKAHQIEQLTAEKTMLESASTQTSDMTYSNVLAQQAWKKMSDFSLSVQREELSTIQEYKSQMTELFSGKNAATGKATDFTARIAEIQAQIDSLSATTASPSSEIVAPSSGYFVSTLDGYENFATLEEILEMNAEDLQKIFDEKNRTASTENAGKIIIEYDWYLIALVPNDKLSALEEVASESLLTNWNHRKEKVVDITMIFNTSQTIKGILTDTKPRQGEDQTIVVFQCNDMNSDLATLRKKEIGIVEKETSGLRVPRSAIRFNEDGDPGVFITIGGETKFRKLDVVSFDDNYVLSAIHDDAASLRTYLQRDDIILLNTTGFST